MLNQKYSRINNFEHRPVETAAAILDEGVALVFVKEGDLTVVRPSTGTAGEVFAGVSYARNVPPLFVPFVYEGVVDQSEGLELPRMPIAGQILVSLNGVAASIVADVPSIDAEGKVSVDGVDLDFHADDDGKALRVQFMYEPTVSEARQFKGDMPIGGLSSSAQGVIGLVTSGDISTSYFDASADFSGALRVNLGADGKFTVGGSGVEVQGAVVVQAPSSENPMLTIRLG